MLMKFGGYEFNVRSCKFSEEGETEKEYIFPLLLWMIQPQN